MVYYTSMSDNESSIQVTEKKKAKRVVSEAHREKLKANLEAARVARVAKIAERRAGRNEDELALKELIAEKKRTLTNLYRSICPSWLRVGRHQVDWRLLDCHRCCLIV